MATDDNLLDNTLTDDNDQKSASSLEMTVENGTVVVLEKVERTLGNLSLNIHETNLMSGKQDTIFESQMLKMRNQEQLLSRSIDRQIEVINKQEKLLWETIENHKEMIKRQESVFLDMTQGITQVLEHSLSRGDSPRQIDAQQGHKSGLLHSRGDSPRQVYAHQDNNTGLLHSRGDSPRLDQHDQEERRQHSYEDGLGFLTF